MGSGHRRSTRRSTRRGITVVDRAKLQRTVSGTAVGNFMEWYDFGLFGFLATTLATVFYPGASGLGLVATFATFAVSFVVRPFGGFFFGPLADRIGRKRVLMITVTMMAAGTFAIGVLPGHESIGPWAFILLIAARVVQGFSTGGEYADAMVYINEHAPDRRRGFWVSWLPVGTLAGYITGAGLVTILTVVLSEDAMTSWGWRVPFLLAGVIGIVGLYIRLRLEESPAFEQQQEQGDARRQEGSRFRRTVLDQWRPLLVVIGLVTAVNIVIYTLNTYLPTHLERTLGLSNTRALVIILIVMVLLALVVPLVAGLSDRIGRRPVMWVGSVLAVVGALPAFLLMRAGGDFLIFAGVLLIGLMLLGFTTVEPATLPALFPTDVRGGAVSVGYNIGVSLFGGTTPLIMETLVTSTGSALVPAYWLMLAGLVGAVAVWFTPEPAGKPLPGTQPTAASEEEAREIAAEDRRGETRT